MAAVTDNSQPPGPDERPAPGEDEQQPRLDPEQWRQFQEFQRFQEYLRYTRGNGSGEAGGELAEWRPTQPPVPAQPRDPVPYRLQQAGPDGAPADAPTPPTGQPQLHQQMAGMQQQLTRISETQEAAERRANPPLWRKILRNKWVHRLVVLAVLLALGPWIVTSLIGSDSTEDGATKLNTPLRRAEKSFLNPEDAVPFVYYSIAELSADPGNRKGAELFCTKAFNANAARDFARVAGAADCAGAALSISSRVTDATGYRAARGPDFRPDQLRSGTITESPCDIRVSGGPRLGEFTLSRYDDTGRWEITGVAEGAPCPGR